MATNVTPISINVRPLQVAHLCFEVDGILALDGVFTKPLQLGARVPRPPNPGEIGLFDFAKFYALLGSMPTVAGDPSRLLYDFLKIQAETRPYTLASLRAESRKAVLDKAINARQNAYFAKYGNAPAIIAQMNSYYSSSVIGSKPQRLEVLTTISNDQWTALKNAYDESKRGFGVVVKTTSSSLTSNTTSYGYSAASGLTYQSGWTAGWPGWVWTKASAVVQDPPNPWPAPSTWPPPDGQPLKPPTPPSKLTQMTENVDWFYPNYPDAAIDQNLQLSSSYQVVSSQDKAYQDQQITNTGYTYRTPYFEAAAQYERAQISLIDQQFAQFMYGQNLPHLAQVFRNELTSIDSDVYRLQIGYVNTILMSPIPGIITGVYKNPGDAVRAGETVMRIENNEDILLVATLVYRGSILIGSTVTVQTNAFDSLPVTIIGTAVAVRGRQQDDHWEVIVQCKNPIDGSGAPLLPCGYHFDYDDTTVSIS
jgi:biotin carboxyl carrier protein